ncbi:MAG: AAA family ATPase [Candidatus Geothermarchaeales archaeon]
MYLREIRARNFKTYPNVKIPLVKGLNVVTGPNGSGKSNVVEAILFGLGEFNPRMFRASTFSDVRTRLGEHRLGRETSVYLTLSDEDGNDVLKLKRTIRPDGKMSYFVNGRRVSRKNYMNALLTYEEEPIRHRYLAQGSVIRTAEMTPKEIRKLLEDTLGISAYDDRREKAMKLLHEADQKLRVSIAKIDEIRGNLMNLFTEALNASRKTLAEEGLKRLVASKRCLEIGAREKALNDVEQRLTEVGKKRAKLKKKCETLEEEKNRVLGEASRLSEEMSERGGEKLRELEKERAELLSEEKTIDWVVKKELERVEALIRENEGLKREAVEIRSTIRDSKKDIKKLERESKASEREIKKLTAKEEELREELERILEMRGRLASSSADEAEKKERILFKGVEREAERRVSKLKKDLLEVEIEAAERRLKTLDSSLERIGQLIEELKKTRLKRREEIRAIKREINSLRKRKRRLQQEIGRAVRIHDRAKSLCLKISVNKELRDRITATIVDARKVFEVARKGVIPNVRGIMSDLIEAPPEIKKLCGIVVEEKWNSLVVDDWETAEKVYELAKRLNRKILITVLSDYGKKERGGKEEARTLLKYVKAPKEMKFLVGELYGNTVIVKDLRGAFEKTMEGFDAIDERGEFYVRRGIFRAGKPPATIRPRFLPVKNIREAETAIREFGKMIQLRRKDLLDMDRRIDTLSKNLIAETGSFENVSGAIRAFVKNIDAMKRIRKTLVSRIEKTREALSRAEEEEEKIRVEIEELMNEVSEIEGVRRDDALRSLDEKAQEVRNLIAGVREEISKIRVRDESLAERKRMLAETVEKVFSSEVDSKREKIRINKAKVKEVMASVRGAERRKKEIAKALIKLEEKRKVLEAQISEYKKRIAEKKEEANRLEEKIKTLYDGLDRLWRSEAELREEKGNVSKEIGKLRTELKILGFEHPVRVGNQRVVDELVETLTGEIGEIGRVNLLARASYSSRSMIYKKFSERRNELEREKNAILDFIDSIDREKERVFMEGLSKINEKFRDLFVDMNPEGEAELVPDNPENIFEGGINIVVRFPTKPKVEMTSLSGGEKSIVVVAFLLALQTVERSTIYLFDEMDAHLDPKNVLKFAEVLKERSKESQTVVVTLKPSVAEVADNLIGVAMRRGVSRVFPMPIELLAQRSR